MKSTLLRPRGWNRDGFTIFTLLFISMALVLPPVDGKNDGLARIPLRGWNSWNWVGDSECNTTGRCLDEIVIQQMADALVSTGMQAVGYNIINLSEGWPSNTRLANGSLIGDPIRFPSGIPALAEYIHNKGLRFGIYLDSGIYTCAGHPGSWGYEAIDIAMIAENYKADYLWLDGCNMPSGSNYTATYALWSTMLNQSGQPIAWEASIPAYTPVNYDWVSSIAHEWRYYNDIRADWDVIMGIVDYTITNNILSYIRPGQYPLLDMMEVGNEPLTVAESRSHFSLWCIFAQPLHAGNDIRNMSNDILTILTNTEAIMIDSDPLVQPAYLVTKINGTNIQNHQQGYFKQLETYDKRRLDWNGGNTIMDNGSSKPQPLQQGFESDTVYIRDQSKIDASSVTCNNWNITYNGYNETCQGPAGNILCFNSTTLDEANATCCNNPLCAGFSYNPGTLSGCYKKDMNCGFTPDPGYSGYSKPGYIPPAEIDIYARLLSDTSVAVLFLNRGTVPTTACMDWTMLHLNSYETVFVRDIWLHQDMGWFMTQYCVMVQPHDVVFVRVHQ